MQKKVFFLLIVFQLCILPLYAEDYNALRKFARGVVNTTFAWIEVPRQMIKIKEAEGNAVSGEFSGFFWGFVKGTGYFLRRMSIGVYEIVTFPIPTYKPLVEPEFIFSDQQQGKEE